MLLGLHGKKQAGKDTVYERVAALYGVHGATVERVSFADLLYESAAAALGVFPDDLRRWKSEPEAGVRVYTDTGQVAIDLTIREYLQFYGTEAHREVFADNFWVDAARAKLANHEGKIVCVTDVRFDNEAEAVFNAGGIVVQVLGPWEVEGAIDDHASERPLPRHLINAVLYNVVRDDGFRALDDGIRELVARNVLAERVAGGTADPMRRPHS